MKRISLLAFALLLLAAACKKDKDNTTPTDKPGPGEELTTSITEGITSIDSLSSFAGFLKDLKLSDADATAGVTVFAPVNSAFTDPGARQAAPGKGSLRDALPDSSDLEDYIVKGVFQLNTLTDGKKMTTLNGNTLTVSKEGADTRINGVLMSAKEISTSGQSVVYSIAGLLKKSPAITVTVWDATKWATDKPCGVVTGDATVSLYHSQEDFAAGQTPAYTAITGADGKARFKNIDAGKYYIVAEKGEESSILKQPGFWSMLPVNNVYTGFMFDSLFQTQGEASGSPMQTNQTPGNIRFTDVNGDGKIDNHDYVTLPYHSAVAEAGNGVAVSVLMGYGNITLGPIADITAAKTALDYCYTQDAITYHNMNMLDGYLSDDADAAQTPWMPVDMFTFNPTEPHITAPWNVYNGILPQLNRIIRDVPSMPESTDKNTILAEAKALRGHIYLQLLTYYNSVPVMTGVYLPAGVTNTDPQKVYDLVVADLQAAETALPPSWSGTDAYRLTSTAASALLAKAALQKKDYATAATYAQKVISSGRYQLAASGDIFNTAYNKEIIWDLTDRNQTAEFQSYFTKGSRCPVIRLSEIYLIASESSLEQKGVSAELGSLLTPLCLRSGYGTLSPGSSQSQAFGQLQDIWKSEMSREENRYACLQRWGIAAQVLASKGYNATRNSWLPIPISFLNNYPTLIQNAGY